MNTLLRTAKFHRWLTGIRDTKGKARILARLDAAALGHFGDCAPIGQGVTEMRIHFGPGYRVYFLQQQRHVYVLLGGGDKSTQLRDNRSAIAMARKLEDQ